MQPTRTDVIVVGAGPAGLMTAFLLAEAGVQVVIVDREARTTARSYACALHPSTLRLLDRVGLATPLVQLGRKITDAAFYEQAQLHGRVSFAQPGHEFPFLLVLPQSALEHTLEEQLRARFGIQILWNHRFDDLDQGPDSVEAQIDQLEDTTSGYIVPHWQIGVKRRVPFRCQYLVGADGPNSMVRRRLGIDFVRASPPQQFAAFEFVPGSPTPDELRIAMDEQTTNMLWPLPDHRCRWSFQITDLPETKADFPPKERSAVRLGQKIVDDELRAYVEKVAGQRAPWFSSQVTEITWCTRVTFESRHATQFGRDNSLLVGDAAHQTGPVGAQSMNAGMHEAAQVASALAAIIRKNAPADVLASCLADQKRSWQHLLGVTDNSGTTDPTGAIAARAATNPWVKAHSRRILPCLPGLGADLTQLADQLQLDFRSGAKPSHGTE